MPPKSSASADAAAKGGKTTKDCLFLMEVLVDKITFFKSPCFSDTSFRTSVTVTAPKIATIEIGDDEGTGGGAGPFSRTFNSGKSCLFSMQEADVKSSMNKFFVHVSVAKSLPCGCLPARIELGKADIDLTKEFVESRNKNLADPNTVSYQALQDTFRLLGDDNSDTGEITMFLRISCFGGLIMTKFQGSGGPLTLGAGTSGNIDRSCNPRKSYQTTDEPCVCGSAHGGAGKQGSGVSMGQGCRGGGSKTCPPARDPCNIMPCEEADDACFCTGPHPVVKAPLDCRATDDYCLHVPKGRSTNYEEIGTTLGGNELKIKVPAESAIIKKISQTHCAIQKPYEKDSKKKDGKPDGPCDPPCGKNQISLGLPCEATCCQGPRLADTQFTYTAEGCAAASKHGQQAGNQGRVDIKHQDLVNKDVFVLKVAKTAMQGDRKCRFELELTAPKAGDKRIPLQKINTKLQSNECECCDNRGRKKRY